ncbi:MAG: class I SAM-dependent methyltransferase [Bacteroidetes bacterium]|nr:class I SAM-dependent methyltransferase [Bacteroidota bacterium]
MKQTEGFESIMNPVETDDIYRNLPLNEIPWNIETPPEELVQLVKSGKIKPCKAIDLGCGAGNYAIWLAGLGFDVTGIDISPRAIEFAKENAERKKVACDFIAADACADLTKVVKGTFDFAFEWEVLHHIYPEERQRYIENVHRILNPGGNYCTVCFSEKDTSFPGSGKYRKTRIGTVLYFSSEEELKSIYSPYFNILELKTIEIIGKSIPHMVNYALMKKKTEV